MGFFYYFEPKNKTQWDHGKNEQQFGWSIIARGNVSSCTNWIVDINHWWCFSIDAGAYFNFDCILCTKPIETGRTQSTIAHIEFSTITNACTISTAIDCFSTSTCINIATKWTYQWTSNDKCSRYKRIANHQTVSVSSLRCSNQLKNFNTFSFPFLLFF